eukprot:14032444-Alexandrium_andersonii.AAC.1
MSVQAIALCSDPAKTLHASHLGDGAFLHPILHDIADVERHPPSGDHEGEDTVLRISDSPSGSPAFSWA